MKIAFVCVVGFAIFSPLCSAADEFTLQDFLNRTWRNECVEFPLSRAHTKAAKAGKALVGPDGKPVLYQIVPGATKKAPSTIAFLADLDPFETRAYRFTNSNAKVTTDLKIEENADLIRISTDSTGISIRRKLSDGVGPIESIKLKSGKWIGGSRLLATDQPLTSYTAEIAARGPVFAEAVCRATFAGTNQWSIRFRVQAHDPVVLVEEFCSLGDNSQFVLSVSDHFSPDSLFYRQGVRGYHDKLVTTKITAVDPPVFVWEPWLHWGRNTRQGVWFGLFNEATPDLLALGAREAGLWVDPAIELAKQSPTRIELVQSERGLEMCFPLKLGQRKWMIATVDKQASLASLSDEKNPYAAPLPQQYLIKHGDAPLDRVKNYALRWKADVENHPRTVLTRADVARFRASVTNRADYEQRMPIYLKSPGNRPEQTAQLAAYFVTENPQLARKLIEDMLPGLQWCVDVYLKSGALSTAPPIHPPEVLLLADLVMNSSVMTPAERERILAQAAFLGYTLHRPDNWSPERGFSANPNMTTSIRAAKALVACFIPSHPQSKAWVKDGLDELKHELDNWADANGGWLESPHYAMVSYDTMLGTFLMARNAGLADYVYHPKMRKVIEWLGKISTPPDSRIKGWRHLPQLGNTWLREPCGEFAQIAYLWRERDPEFAANMQWMWRQHGSFPQPGIGGAYPSLDLLRAFLRDEHIPEKAPAWKSELFPETGVILRNKFPCDRETQLHMIAGNNHAHYDMDSGSITLWGKGRIIADDFGYYGCITADEHSMITSPLTAMDQAMKVTAFAPSDRFDYVAGVKNGWTRQIAFLKDPDPLAPNYFVVADSLSSPTNATWRLWLTANKVTPSGQNSLVEGKEDVDTDIFFAAPASVPLKTEELTRKVGCGMDTDGGQRPMDSTQTGLIAAVPQTQGFTVVLYPRLKTEKSATFTSLADGKVVKVQSEAGTDYVFLSAKPFQFKEGDIAFEGTVGAAQSRGSRLSLSLGAAGTISAKGQTLAAGKPATKEW